VMLWVPEQGQMVLACVGLSGFSHPSGSNFTSVDSNVLLPFLSIQTHTFACVLMLVCVATYSSTRFGELLYDCVSCIYLIFLYEYI